MEIHRLCRTIFYFLSNEGLAHESRVHLLVCRKDVSRSFWNKLYLITSALGLIMASSLFLLQLTLSKTLTGPILFDSYDALHGVAVVYVTRIFF